ncbi:uncharacterized protein BKA55DRAFT_552560 [Fusarium redolens]|jgi:hypothetical protein|uniref:Uncharacterized protein n=1 Tax=Fusarium redolens TaxID=48865 RepID=A0A9P9KY81_FUSRE|nr:uncharacterized protein BKA55DRAFT_552560 [Fusarium redolens]KAH7270736.1 hypothetical protein BKA55DRAFT_552560 [Fusarium redolens]
MSSCVSVASGVSPLWGDENTDGTEEAMLHQLKPGKLAAKSFDYTDKIEVTTRF